MVNYLADKTEYSDWSKEDFIKEIKKLKKRKKYGIVWDEEKTKEKFDKEFFNLIGDILVDIINSKGDK